MRRIPAAEHSSGRLHADGLACGDPSASRRLSGASQRKFVPQSSVVLIACILLLLLHGAAAAAVAVVIAAAVRSMAQLLRAVGLEPSDLELKTGDRVRLIASLDTPLGRIELG